MRNLTVTCVGIDQNENEAGDVISQFVHLRGNGLTIDFVQEDPADFGNFVVEQSYTISVQ